MITDNASMPYTFIRGINKADAKYDWQIAQDSPMLDLAKEKAEGLDNKTGITVALEDFSDSFKSFHGESSSNITADDVKPGFFAKIAAIFGHKETNIYKTDDGRKVLEENGPVYQDDLYEQELKLNNGIMYKKDGDDIYESALNFAKADIGAVEKANYTAGNEGSNKNDKLEPSEIGTYANMDGWLGVDFEGMDLDGNDEYLSPEEYASYIIAADSSNDAPDGKLTTDEAELVKDNSDEKMQEAAKKIYDEHYKD